MLPTLQAALYSLLNVVSVTTTLGSPAVIKASSQLDADDDALPAILIHGAGGQKTSLPQFYEDFFVYVHDRNNGYYRIGTTLEAVRTVLDGAQPSLSGTNKVFEIEWLEDLPWETSRAFRTEVGGALYRAYLSRN